MTRGTVHVWTVSLDADAGRVPSLLNLLSGDERVRAARLRTTEMRVRFVVAHGALRAILSRYLDTEPSAIRIQATALGKPFVADTPVSFNLSHSDALAVCAVTANAQIGIDVERVRPVDDADSIVARYFAAAEAKQYAAFDRAERPAVFFSTWTRKEAFLKATGMGLQQPLDSFEVDGAPAVTSPRLLIASGAQDAEAWHLRAFVPRAEYVGAVALDREIDTLEFFSWSDKDAFSSVQPFSPSREIRT